VYGLWAGAALALLAAIASRWGWPLSFGPGWLLPLPVIAGVASGVAIGLFRPGLTGRELALLLDRALGTDELLVTALHLRDHDSAARPAVMLALAQRLAMAPAVSGALPLRLPRRTCWLPVLGAAAIATLFAPTRHGVGSPRPPRSAVGQEAERLARDLEELEAAFEVPLSEELRRDVDDLLAELDRDRLDEQEAVARIEEVREELQALGEELRPSGDVLEDLASAARDLSAAQATQRLSEALDAGAMEDAAREARALSAAMAEATPEEREGAAQALKDAARRLAQSSDPQMRQVGRAMRGAGEQLGREGPPGGGPRPADEGSQASEELAEELARTKDLADRLRQDGQALDQSQRMNGAMQAAQQRLGQPAERSASSSQAEGPGQGEADEGHGPGQGEGASDWGRGHTWEEQRTPASGLAGAHHDADRTSARQGGQAIDDFEKLYAPVRVEGGQSLLAGVDGHVDVDGHTDTVPVRLSGGEESSQVPLQVPAAYRDAADEALTHERIPPGYRDAVKRYFDTLE
jgi:hypothetical protein